MAKIIVVIILGIEMKIIEMIVYVFTKQNTLEFIKYCKNTFLDKQNSMKYCTNYLCSFFFFFLTSGISGYYGTLQSGTSFKKKILFSNFWL